MRILGISPMHDSSVAIVTDGVVEYFCKEERLSRIKRDQLPFLAIDEAIKHAKGKIDCAVIASPTEEDTANAILMDYVRKKLNIDHVARLCHLHHLTHANLAFYNSGFDKSLVLVIDRNGSLENGMRESESVFMFEYPCNYTALYKTYWLESSGDNFDDNNFVAQEALQRMWEGCEIHAASTMNITKVYETATSLIGQQSLENGKTMGLSAYGKDKPFRSLFVDGLPNTNLFVTLNGINGQPIYRDYARNFTTHVPETSYELYADYAFQVQKQTQQQVLELVKRYVEETDVKKVCVTGGYGLNVVTNEFLIKNLPDVEFYFEPLADDSGNSIGAAMKIYREETQDTKKNPLSHTFFNHSAHSIDIEGIPTTVEKIAELLSQSKVVAVFNGQAEAGPRSLGNRSILFDSRNSDAKQIVNKIKNREWYRPFAGSILEEDFENYFETHGVETSPFMTVSFQVKNNKLDTIPGVIHVDNSCRVQTVNSSINHFYNVLKEFKKITGVPVLLNTSFNLAGEPLVETVEDAIKTFTQTDIDVLWFPEKNIMLEK